MATSFNVIYERFKSKVSDYEWNVYSEQELSAELVDYLYTAISDFKYCRQNLNDYSVIYYEKSESLTAVNGVITLSEIPVDGTITVSYNGNTHVISNVVTYEVDLSSYNIVNATVDVSYTYAESQFNADLINDEIELLTDYMVIRWLNTKFINKQTLLKQSLPSKDFNVYSPANHLKEIVNLRESNRANIERMRSLYTYDNFNINNYLRKP